MVAVNLGGNTIVTVSAVSVMLEEMQMSLLYVPVAIWRLFLHLQRFRNHHQQLLGPKLVRLISREPLMQF